MLVVCECRSIARPLDFEIGGLKTFERRNELLDQKVSQVLELAEHIRREPVGANYDFSWAAQVIAVVVSPFIEWIWERSERLWLSRTRPRILSGAEALRLMDELRSRGELALRD